MAKLPTIEAPKTPLEKLSEPVPSIAGQVLEGAVGVATGIATQLASKKLAETKVLNQQIEAEHRQFEKDAASAQANAEYSSALNKGTTDFLGRLNKRTSETLDEDGNPTFQSLPDDVQNLGNEVRDEILSTIPSEQAKQRFSAGFDRFILQKKTQAFGQARNQQQQFLKAAFTGNLDNLINTAVSTDPGSVNFYISEINDSVEEAVRTGALSPVEAGRIKDEARSRIITGSFKNEIKNNPDQAVELLNKTGDNLVKPDEREKLLGFADSVRQDAVRKLDQATKSQVNAAQATVSNQFAGLNSAIQDNEAGLADVEELRDAALESVAEVVDPVERKKLETQIINESIKSKNRVNSVAGITASKQGLNNAINDSILNDQSLSEFTPKQINGHYEQSIQAMEKAKGEALTIPEKAAVAVKYRGKIKSFQSALASNILRGEPQEAMQAIHAYTHFSDKNSDGLRGFDKDAEAVASVAGRLTLIAGVPPQQAIAEARGRIKTNSQFETKELLRQEFNTTNLKKPKEVENILTDVFDSVISTEPNIPDNSIAFAQQVVKDAFLQTGDIEEAKDLAELRLKRNFGVTEINGVSEVVLLPLEKVIPGVDLTEIRNFAIKEVGLDVNNKNLKLISDGNTATIFDKKGNRVPNYRIVETNEEFGIDIPIINPDDGQPQRWIADPKTIAELRKGIDIAKIREQEARKEQTRQAAEARQKALKTGDPSTKARFGLLNPTIDRGPSADDTKITGKPKP